jgi:uncharacterized protein
MTSRLTHIQIFPVKSLDPCAVDDAIVLTTGALQHDRRFALVDADGEIINGKRTPMVHAIRSTFDFKEDRLHLDLRGQKKSFQMAADRVVLEAWFSDYLPVSVKVVENKVNGFPDDLDARGPTVISAATLETVASWFAISVDDARFRFRTNLEVGGVEPFWEDRLYREKGLGVRFQVGSVLFEGVNPCQRCVVPTRDPKTGDRIRGFQKTFAQRRQESLPAWANISRFDHFYRLAVNTRIVPGQSGVKINVGDEVRILG